jgi:hypothetical protein
MGPVPGMGRGAGGPPRGGMGGGFRGGFAGGAPGAGGARSATCYKVFICKTNTIRTYTDSCL